MEIYHSLYSAQASGHTPGILTIDTGRQAVPLPLGVAPLGRYNSPFPLGTGRQTHSVQDGTGVPTLTHHRTIVQAAILTLN